MSEKVDEVHIQHSTRTFFAICHQLAQTHTVGIYHQLNYWSGRSDIQARLVEITPRLKLKSFSSGHKMSGQAFHRDYQFHERFHVSLLNQAGTTFTAATRNTLHLEPPPTQH